ncbi:hypothetical protein WNY61_20070 [Sulfitobacter sp. AS92]|uniref:hypothetical protein n=1 Tax=Sulfitobacter sp. AS92 TaxID=3135783 RepID=UPI003171868C
MMVKKIKNFYSQDLRIDIVPASMLAALGPQNETYCATAARGCFVVSVAQGDVHEGVYVLLTEQAFDGLLEAREFFETLCSEHPTATYFDFVTHPTGLEAVPEKQETRL